MTHQSIPINIKSGKVAIHQVIASTIVIVATAEELGCQATSDSREFEKS